MFNNTQNLHSTSYRSTTTTTLIVYQVLSDLHYIHVCVRSTSINRQTVVVCSILRRTAR